MGLELVHVKMEIEDGFGVTIPDDSYADMTTVGRLCDWLIAETGKRSERLSRDEAFDRVRRVVCEVSGLSPEEVTWDSRFIDDLDMG